MRIMRFAIIVALIIFTCCDHKEALDYYDDGTVKLECSLEKNLKHGECIEYFQSGAIKHVTNYLRDTLNGMATFYHSNGQIAWVVDFKNGRKNGEITYTDSLGLKFQISNFRDGVLHGESASFYSDGSVLSKMVYDNGVLNGNFNSYHPNGQINTVAVYQNGEKIDFTTYDSTGNVIDRMLNYDISHKILNNRIEISIEIQTPLYNAIGLRVFDYDPDLDSIQGIKIELFNDGHNLKYDLELPKDDNSVFLKGILFEMQKLNNSLGGVVKSSREIEYVINSF